MGLNDPRIVSFPVSLLALLLVIPVHPCMSSAQSPDTTRSPDGFDVQGHRGARGLAPENTIPAFRLALELGVRTLEMDVVLSEDGRVVVSHEPWMAHDKCRTPEGEPIPESEERDHVIFDMTYEQVAAYDCGSIALAEFPEQEPTAAPKPTLPAVIGMAESYVEEEGRAPVFYNVEVKSRPAWEGRYQPAPDVYAEQVLETVREAGVEGRTIIQSFDPRILEAVHTRQPVARTALLVGEGENQSVSTNLELLSFLPDIYSPAVALVDRAMVDAAHRKGLTVIPWTVNDRDRMKELLDLGVDGFITDYPNRAQQVLSAHRDR